MTDYLATSFRFGGSTTVSVADSTTPTQVSADAARARLIVCSGTLTAGRTITFVTQPGWDWTIQNTTTQTITVAAQLGGTTVAVAAAASASVLATSGGFIYESGFEPGGTSSQVLDGTGTAITALPTGLTVGGETLASIKAKADAAAVYPGDATKVLDGTGAAITALPTSLTVSGTTVATIRSGAALGATAVQPATAPSLTGATFTGLTASKYVVTDGSKALASQTGVPLVDLGNAGGAGGDIMYWSGSAWTRLAKPADGDYAITFTSGVPSWTSTKNNVLAGQSSGTAPTGRNVTWRALAGASRTCTTFATPNSGDILAVQGGSDAATNNTIVALGGGKLANGSASNITINTNYGWVTLVYDGTEWAY